jgi:hypothetical protein
MNCHSLFTIVNAGLGGDVMVVVVRVFYRRNLKLIPALWKKAL